MAKIALTGASGGMGSQTLIELMKSQNNHFIRILLLDKPSERAYGKNLVKKYPHDIDVFYGDITNYEDCLRLVNGCDYVLHTAAVIPPLSDHYPELAERVNFGGTMNMVRAVKSMQNEPKFVAVSTLALYGHRNHKHPWARVGDPLLPSPFDVYAASKLRAERYVLDAELRNWAVLRQTGMLHDKMFANNLKDGLMFHTCWNTPLEWVTAHDSGVMLRNLVDYDINGDLPPSFWNKCYNISGGAKNRITGYETLEEGFKIIGGSVERLMKPSWNMLRNFHGVWFMDEDDLNDHLHYQSQTVTEFWQDMGKKHKITKLARIMPQKIISKVAIQRLLGDDNAPKHWLSNNDEGRVRAYFGSRHNVDCYLDDWNDIPLLCKGRLADGDIDYDAVRDKKLVDVFEFRLDHGYDESKHDCDLDIVDMRSAAAFRGGKCLSESMTKGDLYTKLEWECHDGHRFFASPYTILKAGHWCPVCCQPQPWQFDNLAKNIPFFAQVWYDSHAKGENYIYSVDNRGRSKCLCYDAYKLSKSNRIYKTAV